MSAVNIFPVALLVAIVTLIVVLIVVRNRRED